MRDITCQAPNISSTFGCSRKPSMNDSRMCGESQLRLSVPLPCNREVLESSPALRVLMAEANGEGVAGGANEEHLQLIEGRMGETFCPRAPRLSLVEAWEGCLPRGKGDSVEKGRDVIVRNRYPAREVYMSGRGCILEAHMQCLRTQLCM